MATRKVKEGERLEDSYLEKAIAMLEAKSTKKDVCGMLNISYNTARLDKLLENYKLKKERHATLRAEKRGKPVSSDEIAFIVTEYLTGNTISSISESLYRGTTFIRSILEKYQVPERQSSPDYFHPTLIPDGAVAEDFAVGEVVYSTCYDSLAKIVKEVPCPSGKCYSINVMSEAHKCFAYQPVWELASLRHLREQGINI
jgi:hypothetical protein